MQHFAAYVIREVCKNLLYVINIYINISTMRTVISIVFYCFRGGGITIYLATCDFLGVHAKSPPTCTVVCVKKKLDVRSLKYHKLPVFYFKLFKF